MSHSSVFILKIQAASWISCYSMPKQNLAIKALYNIYDVPGVYYCDKYEIIVYTQYAYYTIFIYTVYSLLYNAPINVNPEGGGVGQGVGI